MNPKVKNALIFITIALVFILIYVFFIRKSDEEAGLVSSSPGIVAQDVTTSGDQASITQDFLSLLLSVKSIKLDDSIFFTDAFIKLRDSSIVLTPDGNEGRPNPFAPIGVDIEEILPPEDLDISDLDLDLEINLEDLDL